MRVKFKLDEDRNLFFDSVREKFNGWNEISMLIKVNRNTLLRYRTGEHLISLSIFNILKEYSDLKYLGSKVVFYDNNWGR